MNNRDPFNLRRQSPAASVFKQVSQRALAIGGEAVEHGINMATQRHTDMWQTSRANGTGSANGNTVSEKISGMLGNDRKVSLPMYKDKPYAYPGSRKHMPWYRQKKVIGLVLATLAGVSWWFGILSPLSYVSSSSDEKTPTKSKSSWALFGPSSRPDWDARAGEVKNVFKTSFADYEKHAWGMCRVWLSGQTLPKWS